MSNELSVISSFITLIVFISGFSTLYENTSKSRKTTKFLIRAFAVFIFYISLPIYLFKSHLDDLKHLLSADEIYFSLGIIFFLFAYFLLSSYLTRLFIRFFDNIFKTLINYDEKIGLLYACQSWIEYANNLFSSYEANVDNRFKIVSELFNHLSDYMGLEDVRYSIMIPADEEESHLEIVASSGINPLTTQNFKPSLFQIDYTLNDHKMSEEYPDITVATWVYCNPSYSPKFISNVAKSKIYKIDQNRHAENEAFCLFCVPLIYDGVKIGVLSATGKSGGALFDEIYRDFIYKSIGPLIASYLTR